MAVLGATMDRKTPKTSSIKLTAEAIRLAKIASGYAGESTAEYASRVLVEQAQRDIERLHAEITKPPKGKKS